MAPKLVAVANDAGTPEVLQGRLNEIIVAVVVGPAAGIAGKRAKIAAAIGPEPVDAGAARRSATAIGLAVPTVKGLAAALIAAAEDVLGPNGVMVRARQHQQQ